MSAELELTSWRRMVAELYAAVRAQGDPQRGHALWRNGRDELFRSHPQSPLPPGDKLREVGLPYWPYDPRLRFEAPLLPAGRDISLSVPTNEGSIPMTRLGRVHLPAPVDAVIDVWWLRQYAGGLFLPLRDGTAGESSYGGGRYVLDTAKGADLGGRPGRLIADRNLCAMRRLVVFPAEPGRTRREVRGSDGLPGAERQRGLQHGAPRGALPYPLCSREELGGMFLGLMPYLAPKG